MAFSTSHIRIASMLIILTTELWSMTIWYSVSCLKKIRCSVQNSIRARHWWRR